MAQLPRTARAIDLAISERADGPLFTAADGRRLDRHGAARIVRRVTRRAGIAKHVSPHTLRHAFITAEFDAGVPLRDVQEAADPRTTMRYDRARTQGQRIRESGDARDTVATIVSPPDEHISPVQKRFGDTGDVHQTNSRVSLSP
jgi:integrase